uniref:pyridoxamine 5'-phosphate oxidase family protein n=1 Tax=Peribacillus sp. FSL E2-0159 TaxID=2975289 RepID=UPI00406C36A4
MAKYFPEMLSEHQKFIKKQHLFFIASAPLDAEGHVNLSPKGYDTLRILSSTEITEPNIKMKEGNITERRLE